MNDFERAIQGLRTWKALKPKVPLSTMLAGAIDEASPSGTLNADASDKELADAIEKIIREGLGK